LCDKLCVLDEGAIIETGTPSELAARGGRYTRLLALQQLDQRESDPRASAGS